MQFPRFFRINLGLTALGFVTMAASRIGASRRGLRFQSVIDGVGIALIGAGEVTKLVRLERESQRAAERAGVTQRALGRLGARIGTGPRITRPHQKKLTFRKAPVGGSNV